MKKIKFMALAVVVVLALIGGAYAAWEAEIEIGGTVTTGEFDVVLGDYSDPGIRELPEYADEDESDVELIDSHTAEYAIKGIYPQDPDHDTGEGSGPDGVVYLRPIRMDNVGTVGAVLDNVELELCDSEAWDYVRAQLRVGGSGDWESSRSWSHSNDPMGAPGNFKFEMLDHYIAEAFEYDDEPQVLEPGRFVGFGPDPEGEGSIYFWLDAPSMEDADKINEFQDEELEFTLTFEWKQAN